jgi:hypothetical protein
MLMDMRAADECLATLHCTKHMQVCLHTSLSNVRAVLGKRTWDIIMYESTATKTHMLWKLKHHGYWDIPNMKLKLCKHMVRYMEGKLSFNSGII